MENEFIELKNLNKEWPRKIFEFQKDKDENQYILLSNRIIYLMNNKRNDYLTILFLLIAISLLFAVIEAGDWIDIILYAFGVFLAGKLFYDYKYSPDKANFFKIKKNSDLKNQILALLFVWVLKFIGLIGFLISFLFAGYFFIIVIIFFIKILFG
jgi:hypothetical protein